MDVYFDLPLDLKQALWSHLLPDNSFVEQAAFVLCERIPCGNGTLVLRAAERFTLSAEDVSCSRGDYLELSDACRARLIKRAHDTGYCPLEFHSHLGDEPPAFSLADKRGLEEFVPHIRWRLRQRPYTAIVVSRGGFDGLVWAKDGSDPLPLTAITVDHQRLEPSRLTLPYWRYCNVRNTV